MNTADRRLARIDELMQKAEAVLATHRSPPPNVIGFPTLDSGAFAEWRTQSLAFLKSLLPIDHPYSEEFEEKVKQGHISHVKIGLGVLRVEGGRGIGIA